MTSFFMRFYDQPKYKVEQRVEELRAMFPEIVRAGIEPLLTSLRSKCPVASWRVSLFFATKYQMIEVWQSRRCQHWYANHAHETAGAELHYRKPGSGPRYSIERFRP